MQPVGVLHPPPERSRRIVREVPLWLTEDEAQVLLAVFLSTDQVEGDQEKRIAAKLAAALRALDR